MVVVLLRVTLLPHVGSLVGLLPGVVGVRFERKPDGMRVNQRVPQLVSHQLLKSICQGGTRARPTVVAVSGVSCWRTQIHGSLPDSTNPQKQRRMAR